MGGYRYTKSEKQMNKVMKAQQDELDEMTAQLESMRESGNARISESEELLQSLGYKPERLVNKPLFVQESQPISAPDTWETIVLEAEEREKYDVELEDLLTKEEFQNAYRDLKSINKEFQNRTKLTGPDAAIAIIAAALQTLRWVLIPEIGKTIDSAQRMSDKEGDKLVKKLKEEFVEKHRDWSTEKKSQGRKLRRAEGKTWKEIIFSGVPYDAIKGSKELGLGLSGKTHRYKTLGHDPVLGWVFGTANILTDTMTVNNFMSYRVAKGRLTGESLLLPWLLTETSNRIQGDRYNLPAAVFRQALHYKSDIYTKSGLPVPLLGVFNETLAGQLYSGQYDFLCFIRDSRIEGTSAVLSALINMVIGLIHGLYYNKERDGERDLYDIRTRKILLYSNALASAGNITLTAISGNLKMLDYGGLVVMISRLFSDTRFIARTKEAFIQAELDAGLQEILMDADRMLYVF